MGLFGCGERPEDRTAARMLAAQGESATRGLVEAIESIETSGDKSPFAPNAGLLLFVYAHIEGKRAYSKLEGMTLNPKAAFLRANLDTAEALSLSLTSHVTSSREPTKTVACDREYEPRDALDQLILSWLRNDRQSLEKSLGTEARASLAALTTEHRQLPKGLRYAKSETVAVGYRFLIQGGYQVADSPFHDRLPVMGSGMDSPEIETQFTTASGSECGSERVKFRRTPGDGSPSFYIIDNPDVTQLLARISSCAAVR